jgi:hypothetical protein
MITRAWGLLAEQIEQAGRSNGSIAVASSLSNAE